MTPRARAELAAVVATTFAHLATWQWPVVHAVVVTTAVCGWGGWVLTRAWRDRAASRELGLARRGLGATWWITLPLAVTAAAVFALIGEARGTFATPWTLLALMAIYPIWGLVQQLLVQGLVVKNLRVMRFFAERPWAAALAGGALFGLAHWPMGELMVATTLMGTIFAFIWMRHRNLWPLGLWHGWLGAIFFCWVMGRDPLLDTLRGIPL